MLILALCANVTFSSCSSDDENEPVGGSISNNEVSSSEYVDLGLPSGTLWASRNIGASTIEKEGKHLTWDEANSTENIGEGWSLPCKEQMQELYDSRYTTTTWTSLNGVYGRHIKSKKNGNSIFLPVTKQDERTDFNGEGDYWGFILVPEPVEMVNFDGLGVDVGGDGYVDYQACVLFSYSGNIAVAKVVGSNPVPCCVRPVRIQH